MPRKPMAKVTQADFYRLGEQVASVKARTPMDQWRKMVQDAHKRGFTMSGYLSGQPDQLKERTRSSLVKQAQSTVAKAYDPAQKILDDRERRVRALDQKRVQDNAIYQQWLLGQTAQYNEAARQAQAQYQTYLQGVQAQVAQQFTQAQQTAQQNAQAQSTVSDMGQSKAIAGLASDKDRATGLVANQQAKTAAMTPGVEQALTANIAAALGFGQKAEELRTSQTGSQLKDVNEQRGELTQGRTAAFLQELQRLEAGEVEKAASNRDAGIAAQKLLSEQTERDREWRKWKDQLRLDIRKQDAAELDARGRRAIDWEKIRREEGRAAADRRLARWKERQANKRAELDRDSDGDGKPDKGGKVTEGQRSRSQQNYQTVATALGELRRLHDKARKPNPQYTRDQFRQVLRNKGYSDVMIDLAEDARRNNGKLSARGRAKARQIGILNPEQLTF